MSLYVFYNFLFSRYNTNIEGKHSRKRKEVVIMKKIFSKLETIMEEYYFSFHKNRF